MLRTALALAAALTLIAGPGLAGETGTDAADDNGGIGPDITRVTVDVDGSDLVIAVELVTDPPLTWSESEEYTDTIMIAASTDREAPPDEVLQGARSTMNGFSVGVHAANIDSPPPFGRIVNGQSRDIEPGIARVEVDGRTVTLFVPLEAIGSPESVHLFVFAGREGPAVGMDTYPDETWASYDLATLSAAGGSTSTGPFVAVIALAAFALLAILVGRTVRRPITHVDARASAHRVTRG